MDRTPQPLPEAHLPSRDSAKDMSKRFPVHVRTTFVRLIRSQQVPASAAASAA